MAENELTAIIAGILIAATLKNLDHPASLGVMNDPSSIGGAVLLARSIVAQSRSSR